MSGVSALGSEGFDLFLESELLSLEFLTLRFVGRRACAFVLDLRFEDW
jgi:hypothetical protein